MIFNLPIKFSLNSWLELQDAMKQENIKDDGYYFEHLCCKEMEWFLKHGNDYDFSNRLRMCFENHQNITELKTYCPFCGKQIIFIWKVVGTFNATITKKTQTVQSFELIK
jgi:hypothetical protein